MHAAEKLTAPVIIYAKSCGQGGSRSTISSTVALEPDSPSWPELRIPRNSHPVSFTVLVPVLSTPERIILCILPANQQHHSRPFDVQHSMQDHQDLDLPEIEIWQVACTPTNLPGTFSFSQEGTCAEDCGLLCNYTIGPKHANMTL